MTTVAEVERSQLCDLFEQVGPQAPTLCSGWDTHHLLAHLVVREGPLDVRHLRNRDAAVEQAVATRDFAALVADLRAGPTGISPFRLPFADALGNGLELLVHHEDVRRARPGFSPRTLPDWAEDEVWRHLGVAGRGLLRKAPVGVALRRTGTGELRVVAKHPHAVVLDGRPSELALFAFGRGAVAQVGYDGAAEDVAALRAARFEI